MPEHRDGVGVGDEPTEPIGHQRIVESRDGVVRRRRSANRPARPGPNDEPDDIDTRSLASVVRA